MQTCYAKWLSTCSGYCEFNVTWFMCVWSGVELSLCFFSFFICRILAGCCFVCICCHITWWIKVNTIHQFQRVFASRLSSIKSRSRTRRPSSDLFGRQIICHRDRPSAKSGPAGPSYDGSRRWEMNWKRWTRRRRRRPARPSTYWTCIATSALMRPTAEPSQRATQWRHSATTSHTAPRRPILPSLISISSWPCSSARADVRRWRTHSLSDDGKPAGLDLLSPIC